MDYDEARRLVQPHMKFAQVPRAGGVITEGMINAGTAASLLVGATDNPYLLPLPPGFRAMLTASREGRQQIMWAMKGLNRWTREAAEAYERAGGDGR